MYGAFLQMKLLTVLTEPKLNSWLGQYVSGMCQSPHITHLYLLDLITTLKDTREVDEFTEFIELDENKSHGEVTLSGCVSAEVIKGDLMQLDLHLATLVGQGYDDESAMSSEPVGAATNIKEAAPLADYFHCTMHALNLFCVRD